MGIDVKVHLLKTTGHTLTFQNYRLRNKLLEELSGKIFVIISNTAQ